MEPAGRPASAHLLICHGIGETVEHWSAVQRLLAEKDVASLIFNYSGYGRSGGWINPRQLEGDTVASFNFFGRLRPSEHISILGYSLGSGIAAAIVGRVPAHRLVLCAAFTSLRKAARRTGVPKPLARLLPDIWNTQDALRSCTIPVLIVQGEKDWLFPVQMARDLAGACSAPCNLILVPELTHNRPIYHPDLAYWALIIEGIRSQSGSV